MIVTYLCHRCEAKIDGPFFVDANDRDLCRACFERNRDTCEVCGEMLMTKCECFECSNCGDLVAKGGGVRDVEADCQFCDDSCRDSYAEKAQEASDQAYYGGDGPQTLREQMDAARRLK